MTSTLKTLAALFCLLFFAACGSDEMAPPKPCAMWPVTITAGVNDSLNLELGGPYHPAVAAGTYYDPASLAAAVRAALTAAVANNWAVSVDATGHVSITGTSAFKLYPTRGENLALHSEDLSDPYWTAAGSATVDANVAQAPDGTMTADRVNLPNDITSAVDRLDNAPAATAGAGWTYSMWLKGTAGEQVKLVLFSVTGGGMYHVGTVTVTLGAAWQRFSTTVVQAGAADQVRFGLSRQGVNAAQVMAWGAQLERNLAPTFYEPTTTATVERSDEAVPLHALLGFSGLVGPATSAVGAYQMQNLWCGADPVAFDSYDRPVSIRRAQTRALSGKVRTRTFATQYERTIDLAFLPPHKVFASEEGASHLNEALERMFVSGASRLRWFPDATDLATYADYALEAGTKFDPRRLSAGADLYSQSLRLLRYV